MGEGGCVWCVYGVWEGVGSVCTLTRPKYVYMLYVSWGVRLGMEKTTDCA